MVLLTALWVVNYIASLIEYQSVNYHFPWPSMDPGLRTSTPITGATSSDRNKNRLSSILYVLICRFLLHRNEYLLSFGIHSNLKSPNY